MERLRRAVEELRHKHEDTPYFAEAESKMDVQWRVVIAPFLDAKAWEVAPRIDYSSVLELAPGHGRNSALLRGRAKRLTLVDVNQHCIDACRERFGQPAPGQPGSDGFTCEMSYWVNDGASLAMIPDATITCVYSWDSVVHFDQTVVDKYLDEFNRVLVPGGFGFIHHSNLGRASGDTNWLDNPHWRSTVSAESFASACIRAGLAPVKQRLHDWGRFPRLDCLTLFEKPPPTSRAPASRAPPSAPPPRPQGAPRSAARTPAPSPPPGS